jgi:hypothetical protein
VTDHDRIAYLAGEPDAIVRPEERAGLDDLRTLLADPAVWTEPYSGLEDLVVAAVAAASRVGPPPVVRRRRRRLTTITGLVAAAAITAALLVVMRSGTATEQFRAALAGTTISPGASGEATLTKTSAGWRVTLRATGLPRLANGRFYEAWLKNPSGVLVPIGTFNQPNNITLWAGVPPTNFPVLTVTRQLADGNPASSGHRVLIGVARRVH